MHIENATDLGTVYPSETSWAAFTERRQKLADQVNGGDPGKKVRIHADGRGTERYFMPDINAVWTEQFS
jgi:hypothetical protein